MAKRARAWRKYEEQVYDLLIELGGADTDVRFDQRVDGRLSGVKRQVDVVVTGTFGGRIAGDVTAAVDCKRYTRRVNINTWSRSSVS